MCMGELYGNALGIVASIHSILTVRKQFLNLLFSYFRIIIFILGRLYKCLLHVFSAGGKTVNFLQFWNAF